MNNDRTVGQIVDQVMATIPEEHKNLFAGVMNDLLYTAPEIINNWFNNKFLPMFNRIVPYPPVEEWHFKAVAALTRQSIDDVRMQFQKEVPHEPTT